MIEEMKEIKVDDRQARKTALIVSGVLVLLSAWNFYRGRMTVGIVLGSLGLALLLIGLLLPALARRFHLYWMKLAVALGYLNSRVLLSLLFYLVLTPYGLVLKLFGRDSLNRRKKGRESYWIERENSRQTREQFERLF